MKHNTPKKILAGGKISASHATIIKDAIPIITEAKGLAEVKKIILSVIGPARPSTPRVKFVPMTGCLRLQVRGIHSVQQFLIYTTDVGRVQTRLSQFWDSAKK